MDIRDINKKNKKLIKNINDILSNKSPYYLEYSNEIKNTTKNSVRYNYREVIIKIKDPFGRNVFMLNLENYFDNFSIKLLASKIDNIESLKSLKLLLENY